ncbi:MAG: TIGR00282 family metallophosphoesterase [Elusimicrobiota bacterium]
MNILFIGDIVGRPGRKAINEGLSSIVDREEIDFVIANGENSAGGLGITPKIMNNLIRRGIDVFTSGNHIWKRKEILPVIEEDPRILRPANYPHAAPGRGYHIFKTDKFELAVINIQGRIFLENIDCPFSRMDEILDKVQRVPVKIVDFHAEATSEKIAMGWYLDGKVSAIIGTHTHVQTSDAKLLNEGTAYMSDAGMTGSTDGVIGVKKEEIINKFLTGMPFRFKVSKGNERIQGTVIKVDPETGNAKSIKPVDVDVQV